MKTLRCAFLAFVMAATGFCFGAPLGVDAQETGVEWLDLTLSEAGTLRSQLGDQLTQIDSLVVKGPINADDFAAMSEAVYEGRLRVIDMAGADVEDLRIPDRAFFDAEFEYDDYYKTKVKPGRGLRKIILPEAIEEIGDHAFACEGNLLTVNIPSSLKIIGESAFELCSYFAIDQLSFTDNLTEIRKKAFAYCRRLWIVDFPSSLKEIADSAFHLTRMGHISFQEGLETIGARAFNNCMLAELDLPNSCVNFQGEGQFANNALVSIKFPEVLTEIPDNFALATNINGPCLRELVLPNYVERIGSGAFYGLTFLEDIVLPEGLQELGESAMGLSMNAERVSLPSTLLKMGSNAVGVYSSIRAIYCQAIVPPIYGDDAISMSTDLKDIVPLYIPVGTKAAYQQAEGWKEFTNFIETDDFSMSGIESIQIEGSTTDNIFYDLTGHPVSTPIDGTLYLSKGRKFIFHK